MLSMMSQKLIDLYHLTSEVDNIKDDEGVQACVNHMIEGRTEFIHICNLNNQ